LTSFWSGAAPAQNGRGLLGFFLIENCSVLSFFFLDPIVEPGLAHPGPVCFDPRRISLPFLSFAHRKLVGARSSDATMEIFVVIPESFLSLFSLALPVPFLRGSFVLEGRNVSFSLSLANEGFSVSSLSPAVPPTAWFIARVLG